VPVSFAVTPTPTFDEFAALFPLGEDIVAVKTIAGDQMPEPYHRLLVHTHHMTVTVERFYEDKVDVKVLKVRRDGDDYARKILLTLKNTGRVVQFGMPRVNLSLLSQIVRDEIVAGGTPLGRVLINNHVLRRIEPIAYLEVTLGPVLAGQFDVPPGTRTYGRTGVIFTNEQPAIEVLEVLAPIQPIGK
jgi:chorismate-pyruvate lyase